GRGACRPGGSQAVIIVDTALAQRHSEGRPVRVAMIGAGFMARGVANQVVNSTPGMVLAGISNRTPANAQRAYAEAGLDDVVNVSTERQLAEALAAGRPIVTDVL